MLRQNCYVGETARLPYSLWTAPPSPTSLGHEPCNCGRMLPPCCVLDRRLFRLNRPECWSCIRWSPVSWQGARRIVKCVMHLFRNCYHVYAGSRRVICTTSPPVVHTTTRLPIRN